MLFLDSETVGLHGMPVLLQYAENNGPIVLYDLWEMPSRDSMQLIEWMMTHDVCGFNMAFDHFHLSKWYTTMLEWDKPNECPSDFINEIAYAEERARFLDVCIKPKSVMDLMLHARKGPYQSLMARSDIVIRRVPSQLAPLLADELQQRVEIDGIYFSRKKDPYAPNWKVYPRRDNPEFSDVKLKFQASGGLKTLAEHALKIPKDQILKFGDIELDRKWWPIEFGYAPYALAVSNERKLWTAKIKNRKGKKTGYAWPGVVQKHIDHWAFNDRARKYAEDDIVYTRGLWDFFGRPPSGDDDSELACCVASVRWSGYAVNEDKLRAAKADAEIRKQKAPLNSKKVLEFVGEVMPESERKVFTSTGKQVLMKLAKAKCVCKQVDPELEALGFAAFQGDCPICNNTGVHPASERAKAVISARSAKKEEEIYVKLLKAGRFHASFVVIGTLSSRMSGSGGDLNAQGINRRTEIRDCFTLADDGFDLGGGDFDAFEVVIAEASYGDEELRRAITVPIPCPRCNATGVPEPDDFVCDDCKGAGKLKDGKTCKRCKGKGDVSICQECKGKKEAVIKIHAYFAMDLYPEKTYKQIAQSKGTEEDLYNNGKAGIFSMMYGGDYNTLVRKQLVSEAGAMTGELRFKNRFKGVTAAREKIISQFCPMVQPKGKGTAVIWKDPAEYIESLFGFRRYFTLENKICRALFDLAQSPPKVWKEQKGRVMRDTKEGRLQTAMGATQSALYGAAFGIQGSNMRAAANHVIQSSGATTTKRVQRRVWDVQPSGVGPFLVKPCNIHDEVLSPTKPEKTAEVEAIVYETVESFRPTIPLIKLEWSFGWNSWADK